eukprot:6471462-Amphidinium_carterae.1
MKVANEHGLKLKEDGGFCYTGSALGWQRLTAETAHGLPPATLNDGMSSQHKPAKSSCSPYRNDYIT